MTEAAAATATPPETFLKTMEVDVTAEEQGERKDRLVVVDRKILSVKAEKASKSSDYAQEIKTLEKERLALLEAIGTGREKRDVKCYLERDDRRGMMLTKRVDNNAVIDERALTLEERQVDMFDDKAPESGEAAVHDTERPPAEEAPDADGTEGGPEPEAAAASTVGKVQRVKASDVRKRKAARQAKAEAAAKAGEGNDA